MYPGSAPGPASLTLPCLRPLTDVGAPYTEDRQDNFGIYLPLWLTRYNKEIFGSLFLLGLLYTLVAWQRWMGQRVLWGEAVSFSVVSTSHHMSTLAHLASFVFERNRRYKRFLPSVAL